MHVFYHDATIVTPYHDVTKYRTARTAYTARTALRVVLPLHLFNVSCLFCCLFS